MNVVCVNGGALTTPTDITGWSDPEIYVNHWYCFTPQQTQHLLPVRIIMRCTLPLCRQCPRMMITTSSSFQVFCDLPHWDHCHLGVAPVSSNTTINVLVWPVAPYCGHDVYPLCSGPQSLLSDVVWCGCPITTAASWQSLLTAMKRKDQMRLF